MGTSQKIIQDKIKKRVRVAAAVVVPFVLIGVGSIAYQVSKKGGAKAFDFTIGKLWNWSPFQKEQVVEPATSSVEVKVPKKFIKKSRAVSIQPIQVRPIKRRTLTKEQRAAVQELRTPQKLEQLEVSMQIPQLFNYLPSGRYIDLEKKETLIPEGLEGKRSKLAIGFAFAPGMSYRHFRYNDLSSFARIHNNTAYVYGQSATYRNSNDRAIMSFSSGLDVYFNLNDRWTIQSGVYYASYGERLTVVNRADEEKYVTCLSSDNKFLNRQSVFESPEMVDYHNSEEVPFSNYYNFVEIPLLAEYKVLKLNDATNLGVQLGGSYGYLDHADVLMYNYESNMYYWIPSSNFDLLNKHFVSGLAGVVVNQFISNDIELFANPQFKYVFTGTFNESYEIKQNQWASGLRLGLRMHL